MCCARNGNRYKWYSCSGNTVKYIYKKNKKTAEKLALKKYYQLSLIDLFNELNAIEHCLSKYPEQSKVALFFEQQPEYMNLLCGCFEIQNPDLKNWLSQPYDKNTNHPEGLKFKTSNGIFVRSKSEFIIANTLLQNKIPFKYECALDLNGVILYPDFTILHPKTKQFLYWEHFGMVDSLSYASNTTNKLHTYMSNKIYPTINLITTYETKDAPLNVDMVEEIIKFYFL